MRGGEDNNVKFCSFAVEIEYVQNHYLSSKTWTSSHSRTIKLVINFAS